ncbi:ATP-binding protein [Kocuria coralli]|uniref:ATP-binding protein n=1 Tax=Kocuria coralli TaxID=1461025 RepID=A0A5J5L087_9MICC|nr:ATP-binding protein [Kocuria coralli]KAA9395387.1 ATP-binding protein [Kocuria coralli]
MSHTEIRSQLNYKRVPSRLRRSGLPSATSPVALGPYAYRLFWLGQICLAVLAFALILESLPRLGQLDDGPLSWSLVFLLLHLANTVVMFVFGLQRKVVVWPLIVTAVLGLLAVASVPFMSARELTIQHPWIPSLLTVAAMAVVYVWGTVMGLVYASGSALLYVILSWVQAGPLDGTAALLSFAAQVAVTLVAVMIVSVIRKVAENADEAYNDALAHATALKRSHSQAEAQERLDRLIHDNVMAALLDASRGSDVVSKRTKKLAQRALNVLAFEEKRASGTATTLVHVLEDELLEALTPWRARVRFTSVTPNIRPVGQPRVFLWTEVAQALVQAVTEAVANSARHSGAEITYVTMSGGSCPPTRLNPQGFFLRFDIEDNGRGFQIRAVDERRLGVRVSITGNVQNVGGEVQIHSPLHRGTHVVITWPRDAEHPH